MQAQGENAKTTKKGFSWPETQKPLAVRQQCLPLQHHAALLKMYESLMNSLQIYKTDFF